MTCAITKLHLLHMVYFIINNWFYYNYVFFGIQSYGLIKIKYFLNLKQICNNFLNYNKNVKFKKILTTIHTCFQQQLVELLKASIHLSLSYLKFSPKQKDYYFCTLTHAYYLPHHVHMIRDGNKKNIQTSNI